VKVTTKIKMKEIVTKIPKRVLARQNLPKFGDATEGEVNVTLLSPDFVGIEHPDDEEVDDSDDLGNSLTNFILKQQERAFERENDMASLLESLEEGQKAAAEGESKDEPAAQSTSGKYVPPAARGRAGDSSFSKDRGGGDRDHENTLRVSNLTKAVTEDDLRALFQRFGQIYRVSLPKAERKDLNGNIFKEPRGFAYIAFANKDDAQRAMDKLQGHGYDHLIIKIEWAKPPSADGPPSGGLNGGYVSGYGTKLAQDTKEQVLYASNLTGNR
jgi:translation initiation factor 3 subunit G